MRRLVIALVIFLAACGLAPAYADDPPPARPNQPRPDVFSCGSAGDCDQYNPVTKKTRYTAVVRYRYVVMPGCVEGNLGQTLQMALDDARAKLDSNLVFVRDDSRYDLTIRVNCGVSFNAVCGGGQVIGCLGRGFPYVADVDVVDTMRTFFDISQLAIWLHEVVGHALAAWNEQYCRVGNQFFECPNWPDVMNVGPQSRHALEAIEIERWQRTMWPPAFARCWVDVAPDAGVPCVGMTVLGDGTAAIWWCGRSPKANIVSVAYDDDIFDDIDGYWVASRDVGETAVSGCQPGMSVTPAPGRCVFVIMNNALSWPARPWFQLAGCF